MSVYVSICLYICQKYMHIHQSVYVRISSSIFVCISSSISVSIFVCISSSIFFFRAYHGHGAVTVASHSPAPARGLCTFAARSLRQVCRAAAQAQTDRQIQSDLVCATEQLQPVATCTGAPLLRAEVPWQSWLAVVHEVTAEQRRPSNVEKMRSLSNRQPLIRKRSWSFLNQLHTEIQAQKINANVYKVTEII